MASVLTQVLARVQEVLQANVPPGTGVWVDREDAESLAEAPGINIRTRDASVAALGDETDVHQVMVELLIRVRAEPGTPSAEAIHTAVHTPLMRDAVLSVLVESRRLVEYAFDRSEADTTELHKSARYRITYSVPKHLI